MTTTRITIPVTITIEVAAGVDPMTALDYVLTAAERGTRDARTEAPTKVTRVRFDADLDDATTTTL